MATHVLHSGFFPQGGKGAPPEAVCPSLGDFCPPEIWSENNRQISITKEICITIDFAPPEKIPGRKPAFLKTYNYCKLEIKNRDSSLFALRSLFSNGFFDLIISTSLCRKVNQFLTI